MKCKQAEKLLHLNRPGERSEQEDLRLKQHLKICDACRHRKEWVQASDRRLRPVLQKNPATPPSNHLAERILARHPNPLRERPQRFLTFTLRTAALGLFLLFMIQGIETAIKIEKLEASLPAVTFTRPRPHKVHETGFALFPTHPPHLSSPVAPLLLPIAHPVNQLIHWLRENQNLAEEVSRHWQRFSRLKSLRIRSRAS